MLSQSATKVAGRVRRDGRTIDDEAALTRSVGDAARTEENGLHVRRVRYADDDHVRNGGYAGWRGRLLRTRLHQGRGPTRGTIPHGQRRPGLEKVGGHGGAHRPEANKPDALHSAPYSG